jgi:hypothetical protein
MIGVGWRGGGEQVGRGRYGAWSVVAGSGSERHSRLVFNCSFAVVDVIGVD